MYQSPEASCSCVAAAQVLQARPLIYLAPWLVTIQPDFDSKPLMAGIHTYVRSREVARRVQIVSCLILFISFMVVILNVYDCITENCSVLPIQLAEFGSLWLGMTVIHTASWNDNRMRSGTCVVLNWALKGILAIMRRANCLWLCPLQWLILNVQHVDPDVSQNKCIKCTLNLGDLWQICQV